METQVKITGELDKLVREATTSTTIKPDVNRFRRIAELVNAKPTIPKEFVKMLKSRLAAAKHPKSQFLLLDLIEYTTCKCGVHLHNEYNSKVFLQQINAIFNQKMLTDEVRDKALFLIQFWHYFFINKADVLGNFTEYYNTIRKRGVQFPAKTQSDYFVENESPKRKAKAESQSMSINVEHTSKDQEKNAIDISSFTEKQKKLWKDLNVVVDNVELANSLIDAKEWESLEEVMNNLEIMEKKLQVLPDKLQKADESFLCDFTNALLADIVTTKSRYIALNQGIRPEPFAAKTTAVVKKQSDPSSQFNFDERENHFGLIKEEPPVINKSNSGFGGFGDDGFGISSNNKSSDNGLQDFDDVSNEFGHNIVPPIAYDDPFGGKDTDFNFGSYSKPQPKNDLKDDFDLLDLEPKEEQKPQVVFGSSPKNKTPFDLDFTVEDNQKPLNVELAFGMQKTQGAKHNPSNDIKFENKNTLFGEEHNQPDPFSNITGFNEFGDNKSNTEKPAKKEDEFLF